MMSIAALISPATPIASTTSTHLEAEEPALLGRVRTTIRPCVSAECRKITCGMTVAPRMPAASSTLSGPRNCGTTA